MRRRSACSASAGKIYGNEPDPGGLRYRYHRLVCGDWWDEDPYSPRYNHFVHVPCGVRRLRCDVRGALDGDDGLPVLRGPALQHGSDRRWAQGAGVGDLPAQLGRRRDRRLRGATQESPARCPALAQAGGRSGRRDRHQHSGRAPSLTASQSRSGACVIIRVADADALPRHPRAAEADGGRGGGCDRFSPRRVAGRDRYALPSGPRPCGRQRCRGQLCGGWLAGGQARLAGPEAHRAGAGGPQ